MILGIRLWCCVFAWHKRIIAGNNVAQLWAVSRVVLAIKMHLKYVFWGSLWKKIARCARNKSKAKLVKSRETVFTNQG